MVKRLEVGDLVRVGESKSYWDPKWSGALAVVVGDTYLGAGLPNAERTPVKRLSDGEIANVLTARLEPAEQEGR